MPSTKRAPGKRLRAKDARKSLAKVRALALDMEEPLTEAAAFLVALQLIGYGLSANRDNGGDAVSTIARATSERLDALKDLWDRMFVHSKRDR
jgi:hypothetical protein